MNYLSSSRRSFLKRIGLGALVAPYVSRGLWGKSPNGMVNHATFGAMGQAASDYSAIAKHPKINLMAVADVDLNRTIAVRKQFPNARIYQDWRELLDKEKDLDSVNVSVPDHMHAPIAMSAMQLGRHVYVEKPLTHDIYETRRLTEMAREKKIVSQMGIQIHSNMEYRLAVRLIQDLTIGKIKEVHTWSNKKWGDTEAMPAATDPVPEGLNWDLWLGVCASRGFIGNGWYHPSNWRKRLDFGTGTFGDMGCHIFDPVFSSLALTAPVSVRSEGAAPNAHSWATDAVIHYVFPGTRYTEGTQIPIAWYDGDKRPPQEIQALLGGHRMPGQGSIFIGTKGVMVLPHIGKPFLLPDADFAGFKAPEVQGDDHWKQFVEACLGNTKASAPFDYAGPLTESVLLGSVATRFPHTTLDWNAEKIAFTNVKEANALVRRTYREGWSVKGI